MKKLLKILLLIVLIIPVIAKADMGAPEIIQYTAIVVKEGGVDYYSYSEGGLKVGGHLDKDTTVNVQFESIRDGETYLYSCKDDNNCFFVKSTDVLPKEEGLVSPDQNPVYKLSEPNEFLVVVDEVDVREGPSAAYKSLGTLKKGYKGTYKYQLSSHIYVEENGLKGWVEMIDKQVLTKSKTKYIAKYNLKTECGTIPENTIVDSPWTTTMWDGVSIISYHGCDTYVNTFKSSALYSLTDDSTQETFATGKIYETARMEKTLTTVPEGATITLLASYDGVGGPSTRYVEYNGVKGWFIEDKYYDDIKANLPANEPIEEKTSDPPVEIPKETPTEQPTETPTEQPTETTGETKKDDSKESKGLDTLTIVLMCVIGALAIALAAVITIVLVNKKKKAKPEAVAEEAVPTVEATPVVTPTETPVEAPAEEVKEENKEDE